MKIRQMGFDPGGMNMAASVTWKGAGLAMEATADSGFTVGLSSALDEGSGNEGFRPMEMLAMGLAGCTAMDVLSILQKKRQDVREFEVRVNTKSAENHPHVWTWVEVEYVVTGAEIDPAAVERAIALSRERYCPAQAMLRQAVDIQMRYTIQEPEE